MAELLRGMGNKTNKNETESLTCEEQRLRELEARVGQLELEVLTCLRWMRYQAEKEARRLNPDFVVHEYPKA